MDFLVVCSTGILTLINRIDNIQTLVYNLISRVTKHGISQRQYLTNVLSSPCDVSAIPIASVSQNQHRPYIRMASPCVDPLFASLPSTTRLETVYPPSIDSDGPDSNHLKLMLIATGP